MAEAFLSGVIIMFILLFATFFVGDYVAKYFGVGSGAASPVASFLGIPEDTAKWPNALWYIIMPMMATLGIIYGFFEELHIFRHAPNQSLIYTIIGISWSGLLMYTGALRILALVFYQLGALVAAIVFSVVFIIGVVMWGAVRGKSYWGAGWGKGSSLELDLLKTGKYEADAGFKEADHLIHELEHLKSKGQLGTEIGQDLRLKFNKLMVQLGVSLGGSITTEQQEKLRNLAERFKNLE